VFEIIRYHHARYNASCQLFKMPPLLLTIFRNRESVVSARRASARSFDLSGTLTEFRYKRAINQYAIHGDGV
jgi:hypothetical protein